MAAVIRAGPRCNQDPEASSGPPTCMFRSSHWATFYCFSRCISRELDLKWGRQGSSWHQDGMLAFQVVAYYATVLALKQRSLVTDEHGSMDSEDSGVFI